MIDYEALNKYIGKPWVYIEHDCYAVVKQAAKEFFDINIVDLVELPSRPNDAKTAETILEQTEKRQWNKVVEPQGGDVVVLFNRQMVPVHVGLYIEKSNVLHCFGGENMKNGRTRYDHLTVLELIYPYSEFYRYENNHDC